MACFLPAPPRSEAARLVGRTLLYAGRLIMKRASGHIKTLHAGLQFIPLVVEACGGSWRPTAMQTWRTLGSLIAARTALSVGLAVEQLLQSLSVAL